MNQEWKDEVDSLLLAPQQQEKTGKNGGVFTRDERLLEVYWNREESEFEIVSHSGYQRRSTITDIEDVGMCAPIHPTVFVLILPNQAVVAVKVWI